MAIWSKKIKSKEERRGFVKGLAWGLGILAAFTLYKSCWNDFSRTYHEYKSKGRVEYKVKKPEPKKPESVIGNYTYFVDFEEFEKLLPESIETGKEVVYKTAKERKEIKATVKSRPKKVPLHPVSVHKRREIIKHPKEEKKSYVSVTPEPMPEARVNVTYEQKRSIDVDSLKGSILPVYDEREINKLVYWPTGKGLDEEDVDRIEKEIYEALMEDEGIEWYVAGTRDKNPSYADVVALVGDNQLDFAKPDIWGDSAKVSGKYAKSAIKGNDMKYCKLIVPRDLIERINKNVKNGVKTSEIMRKYSLGGMCVKPDMSIERDFYLSWDKRNWEYGILYSDSFFYDGAGNGGGAAGGSGCGGGGGGPGAM